MSLNTYTHIVLLRIETLKILSNKLNKFNLILINTIKIYLILQVLCQKKYTF